jgi:hypothetical protein
MFARALEDSCEDIDLVWKLAADIEAAVHAT